MLPHQSHQSLDTCAPKNAMYLRERHGIRAGYIDDGHKTCFQAFTSDAVLVAKKSTISRGIGTVLLMRDVSSVYQFSTTLQ